MQQSEGEGQIYAKALERICDLVAPLVLKSKFNNIYIKEIYD